jgi:lycopene beta-cyclase
VNQHTSLHFLGGGVAAHVYALVAKDILGDALQGVTMLDASHAVPDRTLCVWSSAASPIASAAVAQWGVIRIGYGKGHVDHVMNGLQYSQYTAASIRALADAQMEITRVTGNAESPDPDAQVSLDSCNRNRDRTQASISLLQHFRGWRIRTSESVFDTNVATMMDFRVDQNDGVCFVYVLPYADNEALVECTVFSSAVWDSELYEVRLRSYIKDIIGATDYDVRATEVGTIPMTDRVPERQHGPSWIAIGTAGGLTKPTTGYTVARCVRDAESMMRSYQSTGVFSVPPALPGRFRWYDRLLLRIIRDEPHEIPRILWTLFSRNPIEQILRFLDEGTSISDEVKIFWSLPWRPFLRAIIRR